MPIRQFIHISSYVLCARDVHKEGVRVCVCVWVLKYFGRPFPSWISFSLSCSLSEEWSKRKGVSHMITLFTIYHYTHDTRQIFDVQSMATKHTHRHTYISTFTNSLTPKWCDYGICTVYTRQQHTPKRRIMNFGSANSECVHIQNTYRYTLRPYDICMKMERALSEATIEPFWIRKRMEKYPNRTNDFS